MTTGYTPRFYAPVIAPPPSISPSPPYPFTDPATDYAALAAAHAVAVNPAGHAALTITLTAGANPRLLSMMGGCVSFIPRLGTYTLPNGNRLPIDDSAIGSAAGTLVIQVWVADQLEIALITRKALRDVSHIAYENVDTTSVGNAFAPLVLTAKDVEIELDSGLNPATATRAAMEAAFLTRFMAGEVSLFVRGGTVIGSAATSPAGSGAAEMTLLFFDEGGCPDSASPFLRTLPALGGNQWQDHPLIAALPAATVDSVPYKAGFVEYEGLKFIEDGREHLTKGIAYYPAESDGENAPFAATLSSAPIVFIAHGNHQAYRDPAKPDHEKCIGIVIRPYGIVFGSIVPLKPVSGGWVPIGWVPLLLGRWIAFGDEELDDASGFTKPFGWDEIRNDKGYTYFQEALARRGIISVSVNCNQASWYSGSSNILLRARMIRSSIDYFLNQLGTSSSIFGGRIDFSQVGLLGHSRGGEAVISVAESPNAGITIRGVMSAAPTDFFATTRTPTGYSFLVILPAADSDVAMNSGAVFYDRAAATPFKCQAYVHSANHNFFNREWKTADNLNDLLPVLSRDEHERLLAAYGLPFFRFALLGHASSAAIFAGTERPAGAATCDVHLSFACQNQLIRTIDDFESGVSIGVPTQISATINRYVQVPNQLPSDSYYGETAALLVASGNVHGTYRYALPTNDVHARHLCLRAAEHYARNSAFPPSASGFQVGLEDASGVTAWVDSDRLGGLPRPYFRKTHDLSKFRGLDITKTMPETFRFPSSMFVEVEPSLDLSNIVAVILRFDRDDERVFLFDDIFIVDPAKAIQ